MFRKEPSVMKSWVEHGNDYFVKLQQEITSYALKMLRPGGMLLYSTCTFSPLEDEQIVSRIHIGDLGALVEVSDNSVNVILGAEQFQGHAGGLDLAVDLAQLGNSLSSRHGLAHQIVRQADVQSALGNVDGPVGVLLEEFSAVSMISSVSSP